MKRKPLRILGWILVLLFGVVLVLVHNNWWVEREKEKRFLTPEKFLSLLDPTGFRRERDWDGIAYFRYGNPQLKLTYIAFYDTDQDGRVDVVMISSCEGGGVRYDIVSTTKEGDEIREQLREFANVFPRDDPWAQGLQRGYEKVRATYLAEHPETKGFPENRPLATK